MSEADKGEIADRVSGVRAQYHFRKTSIGFDAWDVRRLIMLARDLAVIEIDPRQIPEIHQNHWYQAAGQVPSPQSIVEHTRLIQACDLSYPIILGADGRVMDGMHRVCKALLNGVTVLKAVQFRQDPEPDFRQCQPDHLPYD